MTEPIKVPVPSSWFWENVREGTLEIRPPKRTGLTRRTMPKCEAEEEDDWLAFYFYFDNETEAMHFKLKYL